MDLIFLKLVSTDDPINIKSRKLARNLITCKLLLIPLFFPFYWTLLSELIALPSADYSPPLLHIFINYIVWPLCLLFAIFVMLSAFLQFLAPYIVIPILFFKYVVGISLDLFIIIPRIFLGCVLDLLTSYKTSNSPPVLYSRPGALALLVALPIMTYFTNSLWASYYPRLEAMAESNYRKEMDMKMQRQERRDRHNRRVQKKEERKLSLLNSIRNSVLAASNSSTLSDATKHVQQAEDHLSNLYEYRKDYKKAKPIVDTAMSILIHHTYDDPKDKHKWQRQLKKLDRDLRRLTNGYHK